MSLVVVAFIAGLFYLLIRDRNKTDTGSRLSAPRRFTKSSQQSIERVNRSTIGSEPDHRTYTISVSVEDVSTDLGSSRMVVAADCWVPPGQAVTVGERTIKNGMIYVGRDLRNARVWDTEHALIDPSLPVSLASAPVEPLPYWPCYTKLRPSQRGVHLDWLAGGAEDPNIEIGYVFMYFYGLERRYFFDSTPQAELIAVLAEVRRLYNIYHLNGSFRGYANTFIEAAATLKQSETRIYETTPVLARRREPGLHLKVALGQAAMDRQPIPSDWALLWLYQAPEISLRTAATRCPDEIRQLFSLRYADRFGRGVLVKHNNTPLRGHYRAASGGFDVEWAVADLPDVTALKGQLNQIRPLFETCQDDLGTYSRFIGRHPQKRGAREAIGLLPARLAAERLNELDDPFLEWVREKIADEIAVAVEGGDLAKRWLASDAQLTKAGALRKRDAEALVRFLDLLGIGLEPDVRRGADSPRKDRFTVLFQRNEAEPPEASEAYQAATVVLALQAAVAHADDEISEAEKTSIMSHYSSGLGVREEEKARLSAHIEYLFLNPPSLRGMSEAASTRLSLEGRRVAADLALLTALSDGYFDPKESRVLKKIYGLLGLDSASLYNDLHRLQSGGSGPIVVRPATDGASGYGLPEPKLELSEERFSIDMDVVREKLAETRKAAAMLADIFVEEETLPILPEPGYEPLSEPSVFEGLDEAHGSLLSDLVTKAEWPRDLYETTVGTHGLMPGGALEVINEWAFDRIGDAIIEDGDPLLVYLDVWEDYCNDDRAL